jgi:lipid II:glycine glycyltransferase (peptidoglycan interpeptide bridge formation enzyme)
MVKTKLIQDKKVWEDFLKAHPEANFLQSWYWGEFHEKLGHSIHRTGFFSNEKLVGVMLSIVEPAKRGRYLTVPGGPIIDWENKELIDTVFAEMKKIGRQEKCVFVRVRPQLTSGEASKKTFSKAGFVGAPIHLHAELTLQLDITKTEEEILSQMRKTTRYEIRKAQSLRIKVESTINIAAIQQFYDLQLVTAKRQGFIPFSKQFLKEQFRVFAENNMALLYSARHEDKLLAQAFIIFYGTEAVYHYGASTEAGRKFPAAPLLQWEAIQEAKKRGMNRYNFWGIAPQTNSSHRFSGLSLFKRGFGGQEVEYLHAQDLVLDKPRYLINFLVEKTRKFVRSV